MAERDAAEVVSRLERVKTLLRQQREEASFTPFPWFDATRPYGFFTEEQMRVLDAREWPSARPVLSLQEFLRRHRR